MEKVSVAKLVENMLVCYTDITALCVSNLNNHNINNLLRQRDTGSLIALRETQTPGP